MAEIDGATIIAKCLKANGVNYAFGIVGFPVQPIASAMLREGIRFVGMRHERREELLALAFVVAQGEDLFELVDEKGGLAEAP